MVNEKAQSVRGAGSPMIAPLAGCGRAMTGTRTRAAVTTERATRMSDHTNLVCMCCGHIQPVQRDQLPSRCEHCRESFAAHGYFLDDDTTDAGEVSQHILDTTASLLVTGVSR